MIPRLGFFPRMIVELDKMSRAPALFYIWINVAKFKQWKTKSKMKKSEVLDIIASLPEEISPAYLSDLFGSIESQPRRFTDSQKRMLARAEEDVKAGRVIDSEEVHRLTEEWFEKE